MKQTSNRTSGPETPAEAPEQTPESRHRLREILGVLLRHNIAGGITPVKLRQIVEDLGPTFVKLGQILSMRRDMLPAEYCRELGKLRADVHPLSYEEVRAVVEGEYEARLDKVFASFEKEPLGAASIAQAHAAVLKTGERVVVKVQRPSIYDVMARDIALLRRAARLLRHTGTAHVLDFDTILSELWFVAQQELDFLTEARNADEFRRLNRDVAFVACPQIFHRYTTPRVLVMEYVEGFTLQEPDKLTENGYDLNEIGAKLADNYVKQILDDGFFHADPHPGNLRIRDGRIVWLDLGMMGRLSERDKALFRRGVRAIGEQDVGALKEVLLTLGVHNGRVNHARLYEDIDSLLSRYGSMGMADMDLGRMLEEFLALASDNGISMPEGVTLLGRGLLTLQGVLADIAPELNIVEIVAGRMRERMLTREELTDALKDGGRALLSSGRKALDVPGQLSDLLKMTVKGQTKLSLELTGSEDPLDTAHKIAGRLAAALLAAGLFIGSSLLCLADLQPRLLGIPVPGVIGYLLALVLTGYVAAGFFRKRRH